MRLFHVPATHSPLRARFPGIELNTALARIATLHVGLLRPWPAQDHVRNRDEIIRSPCRGSWRSPRRSAPSAHVDPLQHFNTIGWKEGRDPNAFFDTSGYLATYADVKASGMNPLEHYNQFGWKEGRDPSPDFDTTSYLDAYPDVAWGNTNPLVHYLQYGIHEGRHTFADGVWG